MHKSWALHRTDNEISADAHIATFSRQVVRAVFLVARDAAFFSGRRVGARIYPAVGAASQQSRYGLLDDRIFCTFIHRHLWGECPHLPRVARVADDVVGQPVAG
jgi:hypothetical protein